MIRFRHMLAVAAFAAVAPSMALAQACSGPSGFADVAPTDIFCQNVQWLANRGVTLGCDAGPPALYCPPQSVTRAQMALFMNRLATTLTPRLLRVQDGNFDGPYTSKEGCITEAIPVTTAPLQASFSATVSTINAPSATLFTATLVYSTDGGTTWNPTGDFPSQETIGESGAGSWRTIPVVGGPFNMVVGNTYQFAISAEALLSNAVGGECRLIVRIENRNSATAPF